MLTIAIQAGGESRRMGKNKATLPFLGRPLIQRVVSRLKPLADEIFVTTNAPEEYQFLNLPLYADELPGYGALGGLYTALKAASQALVAVVACDLPFANPELLAALRDELVNTGVDAAVPRSINGIEPLHAVYRRLTCLPAILAALERGDRKMISWFEDVNVRIFEPKEIRPYDPSGRTFINVNTPEEFSLAVKLAREAFEA